MCLCVCVSVADTITRVLMDYHERISSLEDVKFDLEYAVKKKDFEVEFCCFGWQVLSLRIHLHLVIYVQAFLSSSCFSVWVLTSQTNCSNLKTKKRQCGWCRFWSLFILHCLCLSTVRTRAWSKAPHIRNFSIRWRWAVSFTLWLLYPQWHKSGTPCVWCGADTLVVLGTEGERLAFDLSLICSISIPFWFY
jgi:hypothetical protein